MQEISKENMIPGKEYYIECLTTVENSDILVPCSPIYKMIAKFEKLDTVDPTISDYRFAYFTNFRKMRYKKNKKLGYRVYLNKFWKFYEIIEDKIQDSMERRSYNMVLQEIIKDQYFTLKIL